MKRYLEAVAVFALYLLLASCGTAGNRLSVETEVFAMDTVVLLSAFGERADEAITAAEREIERLEALFSLTVPNSSVSAINNTDADIAVIVDDETWRLIYDAAQYSLATDGAFDVTVAPVVSAWGFLSGDYRVPESEELELLLSAVGSEMLLFDNGSISHKDGMSVDLGGIAKGYASDMLARIFDEYKTDSALVSLGGQFICAWGKEGR